MCLCVLLHRCTEGYPLAVAANREERYDRPTAAPRWLPVVPAVFAGQDLAAGGTWLGVNRSGLLVALTNRRSERTEPRRRSRGLLCLDALACGSARAAAAWLAAHLAAHRYNACNLLCADGSDALAVHYDGTAVDQRPLAPGLHLLADTDVDDRDHPRLRRLRHLLGTLPPPRWRPWRDCLRIAMADHAGGGADPAAVCRHGDAGGTVSSTLVALAPGTPATAEFWYAGGPPCRHGYADLSASLRGGMR